MNSIRMINPIRTIIGALIVTVLAALALGAAGATAKDRNDDGISDRWEKRHGLSLNKDQSGRDQDRDGLKNRGEFAAKTDPRDADTDNDGISDGQENAGTIAGYDSETGELTIDLLAGGSVTTLVTEQTEVLCSGKRPPRAERHGKQTGPNGPRGGRRCSTNELVVDAMVHHAKLTEDGLAFKVIHLVKRGLDATGEGPPKPPVDA